MMSSRQEETMRFFHYVEESGLRAYSGLLAQNLDHARNHRHRTLDQDKKDKKRKQDETTRRTGEEDLLIEGKLLRMGSLTMPPPRELTPVPPPHPLACGQGFAVRSQSLHSVGGADDEAGSPTSRKQPPPKPRRDPATKLSMSSEAVDQSPPPSCCDAPDCSEDCRRVPPPKPKRNPNTQLSVSFDESYIKTHAGGGVCCSRARPPGDDSPGDEPVYIEMGGAEAAGSEEEPGESVYEEMKYPALEDSEYRTDPAGCRSACPTPAPYEPEPPGRCPTPRGVALCDIPAPFPNLLTHRPPLLVFPPAPAQCSPNSDESPLTPMDVTKLPALAEPPYSKSPTSSGEAPPPSTLLRRELAATPTLTASGRSSAPPLPCTLYSKASPASYQRSHSACPSPVSMGRCLTPLSLMRAAPFDPSTPFAGAGGLPRSASATPHGKGSPPQDGGGRLHGGSMQNVSAGRSRTPTSPLDELTNLFTTGRNMLKKNASGRKSKEPGEAEAKSKSHGESKRQTKERQSSHSKESKRESKERHHKDSSHRRDGKERDRDRADKGAQESRSHRRNSQERGCSSVEPTPSRRDSRERGCSSVEPVLLTRRDSKDRTTCSNGDPLTARRDSKDRSIAGGGIAGGLGLESLLRQDGKDRDRLLLDHAPPEPPARQEPSRERSRSSADCGRRDSRDRPPELLPRHESKDRTRAEYKPDGKELPPEPLPRQDSRTRKGPEHRPAESLPRPEPARGGPEGPRGGKDRYGSRPEEDRTCCNGGDAPPPPLARQDGKEQNCRTGLESRRDSEDRGLNGAEPQRYEAPEGRSPSGLELRRDSRERANRAEGTPRREGGANYTADQSKAQERNGSTALGQHPFTPTHRVKPSGSPPTTSGAGSEVKAPPKYSRSASTPPPPSPMGTPQRKGGDAQPPLQMPWLCGDSTMLEQIERKRTLCMEIRSRQPPRLQRPLERASPDRTPREKTACRQQSAPPPPGWERSNGAKLPRPPPYPTQKTVFWDTAI